MGRPLRLIVVEDIPDHVELMILALRKGGLDPAWVQVETADALKAALASGGWDAVLSDYSLPEFWATAALEIVRAVDPDLPFLVVSGTVGEEVAAGMMRVGANDYILKQNLSRLAPALKRELREAENRKARRAADRLGQDVLDSLSAHVAVLDSGGTITRINAAWEQFAKVNGAVDRTSCGVGANYLEVCERATGPYADEARPAAAGILQVLRGDVPSSSLEYPCNSPFEERWFLLHATPLRPAGHGAVVSHTDISERKQAEKVILSSEARYRRLFEAAQDGILIVDAVTRKVFDANPFLAKLLGYTREELVGKELWEIGLFRDIEANKAAFRTLQTTGYIRYDNLPLLTHDGRHIAVEFVSNVYDVGDARVIQCNIRDNTEKKRVEEALRRSKERFRQVVEDQTETVLRFTADGKFTFVNDVFRRTFGKPGEDPIGQSWRAIAHPDDLPMIDGKLAGMSAANPVVVIENRVFDAAGSVRWFEFINRAFFDPNDRLIENQVVGRDVTDRKRAEDELRASEQRYRTLVAATTAIVWDSPPSGAFDSDQPAWTAFTGQSVEQHRGWGWLDAIHPDDREMSQRAWAAAMKDRTTYEVEHRLRRADGEYRHMIARAVPILDPGGAVREWVGIHTDITARKRVEASLVESQQRLVLATESAGIGIWDWGVAANETVWDARMFVLYGIRQEDFTGGYDAWRNGLHPDDRDRVEAEIANALAGVKDFHSEFRVVWSGGEVRHIEAHAHVQRSGGTATRMIGVNRDITDQKRAEEAVRASEERFRVFMDHSPATAFIKDEDGRYLYVNASWRGQFDPQPTDWEGKTDYDFWPHETAEQFQASDRDCLARNEIIQFEETARTHFGKELYWLVMKFPLLSGGRWQVGGMAWDISDRKRAEDALRLRDRAIHAATQGLMIIDPGQPDNPVIFVSPA